MLPMWGFKMKNHIDIIKAAQEEIIKILAKNWPIGSQIEFNLRAGQKRPSVGEVFGHTITDAHPLVRIKLLNQKQSYRQKFRYIGIDEIKTPPKESIS
jgi:hypothetical protein